MARAKSHTLHAGFRVGEYELSARIARGGFGVIWRAIHVDTGRVVALKIIRAEMVTSDELVRRLEREANAIRLTRHPNVVELYDFGKLDDGRPYLVMEHVSGVDLDAYVRSRGALPPAEVLAILAPLADALAAVHERGIVHRDIKGSNVMLSSRDGHRRVVLLDFGVAKLLDYNGPPITAPRSTVGTPQCMAPEQILGMAVDARTDVYALGSLLFQMLTGEVPFPGEEITVTNAHLIAERPRPSARVGITTAFDEVVGKAMHRFPEHRYAGALELLEAFRTAVEVEEQAPPPETHTRLAMGIYVDVQASPMAVDAYDDDMLDDMESVVPTAGRELRGAGCLLAYENGNSALFVRPLAPKAMLGPDFRRDTLGLAASLLGVLHDRPGRNPWVLVTIHLHVGSVEIAGDAVVGGSLLDLSLWVAPISNHINADIVVGTAAVVANLDVSVTPLSATPACYRIDTGAFAARGDGSAQHGSG
ncbi:serine/threonine-protein kinase [Haliangium sp.]|uniref:serine/threonine-protein kinase n=1 Tax=Haliangium sp. TaxID=2663208 RepID=UPI003D1156F3